MSTREGSLEAPTRHPLDWKNPDFYNEDKLMHELERVFDICHGCRRCVSLCTAFPTLFDLIDESSTMEVDGVAKADYWKVVDECYLCDLCYMTKCPYVPPHPWNLDFPHTMLRAKAIKFRTHGARFRDKLLSSTDAMGKLASIPVVVQAVNASLKNKPIRKMVDSVLGIHPTAGCPSTAARNSVPPPSRAGISQ
jgi:glycerol-3-phosphate dehydrogenase subunit C